MTEKTVCIHIFRRDYRLDDNTTLIEACKTAETVSEVPTNFVELDTITISSDSEREIYRASEKRINDVFISGSWNSRFNDV